MARAATKEKSTALVNIDEELNKQIAQIGEQIGAPSGIKISTKNKKFRLPDGSVSEEPLNVVVLAFVSFNKFYKGKYDEKNPTPPDCFALNPIIKDMKPHEKASDPQHDDCADCPMNEFGSDGNAKACRNMRLMAVMAADAKGEDAPIYLLEVAPTSLKAFDGYVKALESKGQHIIKHVTEIAMDDGSEYPKLSFRSLGPNKRVPEFFARQAEAINLIMTPPDTTRRTEAKSNARRPTRPAARGKARR